MWRTIGRVICTMAVVIVAKQVPLEELCVEFLTLKSLNKQPPTSPAADETVDYYVLLFMLGCTCGISFKILDLKAEHGLPSIIPVVLAAICSLVFLPLYIFVPSWVISEVVYHGILKGKCDNGLHVLMGIILLSGLLLLPLCSPLDWNAIFVYTTSGIVFNFMNKFMEYGDTLANQFRVDKLIVWLISPSFAAAAYGEQ
jgi:hypothetical protein